VLLWPVPKVRKLRFHDLRLTRKPAFRGPERRPSPRAGSFGHSDVQITDLVYTELEPTWLREQVNRMPLHLEHLLAVSAPDVDRIWTEGTGQTIALNPFEISEADPGLSMRAILDSNQWPLAPDPVTYSG
jgi:hypothetical protein